LGLGGIARSFANGLKAVPGAELYAVGSRSQDKADKFGHEFSVTRRYGSYASLADDKEVDAIYIATPHPFHFEDTLLALNHGKAALCEKPFTINAQEASGLIQKSRETQVFLMEAMWTRFTPIMVKIREIVAEGTIGKVQMVEADFGFRTGMNPASRLLNLELGGGALLDVGVYTISFASMLLGTPSEIKGVANIGETGVDEQSAYSIKYVDGGIAVLSSAVRSNTPHVAAITGEKGRIVVDAPWWNPKRMTLIAEGRDPEVVVLESTGNGYNYEAIEVEECVKAGKIESAVMPHEESLAIMKTMDALRSQWGLVYPQERDKK
jgi:predicted dehydrogenase